MIALLSASMYIGFQLMANVLSTKITTLPLLGWGIDGGTIIYPLTFTVRDFVHKTWGKQKARQLVFIAAGLNIAMAGLFWIVGQMPADPTWPNQAAYEAILTPVWRITFASIIAQVISELLDTEIFSRVYIKMGSVMGVIASNSVALLADSVIFSLIAFYAVLPFNTVLQIIATNIIVKLAVTLLSAPTIKLIPQLASRGEM